MPSDTDNGISDLRQKRAQRVSRRPPPPRHPRSTTPPTPSDDSTAPAATDAAATDVSHAISHEIPPAEAEEATDPRPEPVPLVDAAAGDTEQPSAEPAARSTVKTRPRSRSSMPPLTVDLADPAMRAVTPNVLSISGSVMRRFTMARRDATSHTALVLDAIRQHASELPRLVRARRPSAPAKDDLFPWRAEAGAQPGEPKQHLRIRPLAGEWRVITELAHWVDAEVRGDVGLAGREEVTRSEVVEAALDRYLPSTT